MPFAKRFPLASRVLEESGPMDCPSCHEPAFHSRVVEGDARVHVYAHYPDSGAREVCLVPDPSCCSHPAAVVGTWKVRAEGIVGECAGCHARVLWLLDSYGGGARVLDEREPVEDLAEAFDVFGHRASVDGSRGFTYATQNAG